MKLLPALLAWGVFSAWPSTDFETLQARKFDPLFSFHKMCNLNEKINTKGTVDSDAA